ncbi:MAG: hypothetical protein RJA87_2458 [Pseudomonadota bacterium]
MFGQDPALNLGAPVAGCAFEKAGAVNDGTALWVFGTKDQASDAGMADGTRTHGAGLERHNQRQTGQSIVSDLVRGCAEGEDLGVGGGIVKADGLVPSA